MNAPILSANVGRSIVVWLTHGHRIGGTLKRDDTGDKHAFAVERTSFGCISTIHFNASDVIAIETHFNASDVITIETYQETNHA